MAAITYKEWPGGLDRRLPLGTQDADRLWTLRNAYISAGRKIVKRPGLKLVSSALSGSVGLAALNGVPAVFVEAGTSFTPPEGIAAFTLSAFSGTSAVA